jgi:putative N6-adenine-specific DNA methylase
MPCAAGVEGLLADEVHQLTGLTGNDLLTGRGGVMANASWRDAMRLNLHSRLTQRVLIQLSQTFYRSEKDLYEAASAVAWEIWYTTQQTFKIEITAQHSPLTSLNFAALKIKDAVADRFRDKRGERPDVNTQWPDVRIYVHLTTDSCTLYIDTSGEPLFKRGWREDKGDAPLKETLAAAMLAASGWDAHTPLYDPCCGSGTIAIEAAQIACGIAPGILRRFGFEKLLPFQPHVWQALQNAAREQEHESTAEIHASDVAFRMVDFTQRNAERAGVGQVVQARGGDALQRMPPCETPGIMLLNPPYGERIEVAGVAGAATRRGSNAVAQATAPDWDTDSEAPARQDQSRSDAGAREQAQVSDGGDFFSQLASHWKKNYTGWSAWVLTPDLKLPGRMRLKESRRVPMWNGPIECRLFRFDMSAGSMRRGAKTDPPAS